MKKIVIVLLPLVAVLLQSCLKGNSEYTPLIYFDYAIRGANDTLKVTYDSYTNQYVIDTIQVGDTLHLPVAFDAVGNDLQTVRFAWDTAAVKMNFGTLEQVKSALSAGSDTVNGVFKFNPGYNIVAFPMFVVAKKSGNTTMRFTVESDSRFSPQQNEVVSIIK